jgi:hypothetical protein
VKFGDAPQTASVGVPGQKNELIPRLAAVHSSRQFQEAEAPQGTTRAAAADKKTAALKAADKIDLFGPERIPTLILEK